MSGFQFFHVEPYSLIPSKNHKRQSARNAAAEADRFAIACPHITQLKQPVRLYGCSANEAVDEAERIIAFSTDKRGRKIRKDAYIILSGVVSYPVPIAELASNDENLKHWVRLNLKFLRQKYGSYFKSAIAHIDEKYFHIHFFVLPEVSSKNVLKFSSIHDGIRARESISNLGAKAKVRAYKEAMRALQDEYYEHVGISCGLTREGPKRRRLSREEWIIEQKSAERLAKAESRIEQIRSAVKKVQIVNRANTADIVPRAADLIMMNSEINNVQTNTINRGDYHV
ncbi:plasmid recombination protein [Vibrio parahaemolyticus]|uniref:plasmid recombination protein n=1 Tax=Vibrio parahaemolyticus TaxID=670 RepID=UPI00235FFB6D|nr:plasmid recombination protein [Vibrio parahaemolyticus]